MTATITKWGNSRGLRIPKPLLETLGILENEIVEIGIENNKIFIKKQEKRKTIEERFEQQYGVDFETAIKENPYDCDLVDWGKLEGDEVW